ncbi:MAG: hypothetical protein FJW29_02295 [Acidobacteria bacterium]|nr:hypothetical protein [Acidobacteriota bacterium]
MDAGRCATCAHCQVIDAARSRFYLCRRAFDDPRFRRYPVLPVRHCPGYAPVQAGSEGAPDPSVAPGSRGPGGTPA